MLRRIAITLVGITAATFLAASSAVADEHHSVIHVPIDLGLVDLSEDTNASSHGSHNSDNSHARFGDLEQD